MHYLILALLALLVVYAALRAFTKANPKDMAKNLRSIGGVAALLLALFFAVTGRFPVAIPLGIFALSLLGRNLAGLGGFNPFPGNASKSSGQQSRVRTRTIEMMLDHDTGDMEGRVLDGQFASRQLSSMSQEELTELWAECQKGDAQAALLLEAYMDKRFPDWRDDTAGAGAHGKTGGGSAGPMTRDEAYEVLGLAPDASKADIRRAHRNLMKRMHPDQGGSTYLAAKINQAKDLLLE